MTYDDEVLDVVDDNDNVIAQMSRTDYYKTTPKPGFVRAVNLFLVNPKGEIWVPRRASTQKIKPGALDYSAGGHVAAGETYRQSMRREAQEEIGLTLISDKLVHIGLLPPNGTAGRDWYFCDCFAYYSDEAPVYEPDEFSGHEWLTPEEFLARLEAGENAKDSLKDSLQLLLQYQSQRTGHE